MAGKNTAAKRLKQAIARPKRDYLRELALTGFIEPPVEIDWADRPTRYVHADAALTLREGDEPLRKAFTAFGLDPLDPWHWRRLLDTLACVHPQFAPRAGRKPTRNLGSLVVLLARHGNLPNADLVRAAKKLPKYRDRKTATIEKYLREARKKLERLIEEKVERRARPE